MSDRPVKPLHFSAFVMNTTSHIIQGTWRQPDAGQADFNSLDHWLDLARLLERGKFDTIFFADVVGLYGDFRGDARKYFEAGLQVPSNDPSVLASALAAVTENLGIAFTSSVVQDHPFHFARRVSTLDHITQGRIAWNIVTGYLPNASRNFGHDGLTEHDERYVWGDEYVDVTYKLWEGSWDDGALVQDRESGIHADYDKVHTIDHVGKRYKVEGPHLVSPSPQRSPLLFQAGASPAGKNFAGRNAEAVFIQAPHPEAAAKDIEEIRAIAVEHGRRANDIKFFQGLNFVIGSTEEEAQRRSDELDEWIDFDAQLSHMSGSVGIDFGHEDLDAPLGDIKTEGVRSIFNWINALVTDRQPTLRDVAYYTARTGRVVGTPEQIADRLADWQRAGVDGINVVNITRPGSYAEFIDHVIPVLQERGLAQTEYAPGTLRKKLFGRDTLSERHPAAQYRGAFTS